MDQSAEPQSDQLAEETVFGVEMPANARIGTIVFEDDAKRLRVQLADGGEERIVRAEELRALYGARIRHISVTSTPRKAQGVALSSAALMATTGLPRAVLNPSSRGDNEIQTEDLVFVIAMRIERLPELWYLVASSFNFRKALGDAATYSTELNLREFVRHLSKLAPDAVRDGFFTALLQGSPLPPPVDSMLEFFRIVAR